MTPENRPFDVDARMDIVLIASLPRRTIGTRASGTATITLSITIGRVQSIDDLFVEASKVAHQCLVLVERLERINRGCSLIPPG